MSRRCRASLQDLSSGAAGSASFDSGCDCGRLGGSIGLCSEPLKYGSNILIDSGFEAHKAVTGGGPNGDEIPYHIVDTGGLYWDSDDSIVDSIDPSGWNGTGWVQADSSSAPGWVISTADPDTGLSHARWTVGAAPRSPRVLQAVGFMECAGDKSPNTDNVPVSAIVAGGDLITFSVRAKSTSLVHEATIRLVTRAFDWSSPQQVDTNPSITLTTSYQTITKSLFAKLGAHYLIADLRVSGSDSTEDLDADTGVLSIIPGGQNLLLCAFASLITIDNSTTETSFV